MIRVYLLEDHDGLREDTTFALNAEGLRVKSAANGTEFAAMCAHELPDIAVIDRMLPGEDGLLIASRLHSPAITKKIGIVFLTSLGALDEKLEGLEVGDAYLIKPVDMRELAAVIRSVYRRINFTDGNGRQGVWRVQPRRLELISPQGNVVELSFKEIQILVALAGANGKMISARKLVEVMEEDWLQYEKNRLELLLSRLRQKIRATNEISSNPIKSVRNEGYQVTVSLSVDND